MSHPFSASIEFDCIWDPPPPMKVIVDRHLCQVEFVRWRRQHRKARINKKWQKRYGAIYACSGVAWCLGHLYLLCPCAMAALEADESVIMKKPLSRDEFERRNAAACGMTVAQFRELSTGKPS